MTIITLPNVLIIVVLIICMLIYHKRKKDLQKFSDQQIKTFQNIFDISKDSIIILTDKNEILYANQVAIDFFSLKKHFKFKKLDIPKVKVKDKWVGLDKFIDNKDSKHKNVFSSMEIMHKEVFEVNLYYDTMYRDLGRNKPCTIFVFNDKRKEREKALSEFKCKLTNLPNQQQYSKDFNALCAKLHLQEQKISLVQMHIDNFSTLRSIIGHEQSNLVLIKFADYMKDLAEEFMFSVYHTEYNNFLLILPNIDSTKDILSLIKMIQHELISFYTMGNSKLHLTASVVSQFIQIVLVPIRFWMTLIKH